MFPVLLLSFNFFFVIFLLILAVVVEGVFEQVWASHSHAKLNFE